MSGYTRKHVIFILKSGISYRMLNDFPNINHSNAPHWATVYKFFKKTDRNYQKLMSDKLCGDCLIFRGIKNKI